MTEPKFPPKRLVDVPLTCSLVAFGRVFLDPPRAVVDTYWAFTGRRLVSLVQWKSYSLFAP